MAQIAVQIQQLAKTAVSLSASVEETTAAIQKMDETLGADRRQRRIADGGLGRDGEAR